MGVTALKYASLKLSYICYLCYISQLFCTLKPGGVMLTLYCLNVVKLGEHIFIGTNTNGLFTRPISGHDFALS